MPLKKSKPINKVFNIRNANRCDVGHWRVRLSKADRLGADRHCLLRITHAGKTGYFVGLGHNFDGDVAQIDYDVREHLGIHAKEKAELTIELVTGLGSLCWYLKHRDPYIYVPAYVGVASVVLGAMGLLLALFSFLGGEISCFDCAARMMQKHTN